MSNMNFNQGYPQPASPVSTKWKAGATAGFQLNIPVATNFSIQPEYSFSQMGAELKDAGISFRLNYLSLPLLFKYMIAKKLSLLAGPQFDLLLSAKRSIANVEETVTHDTEERNFGIACGFEYQLPKSIFIDLRFVQGLNHVGLGQRSSVVEFKHQLVQLAAGIKF